MADILAGLPGKHDRSRHRQSQGASLAKWVAGLMGAIALFVGALAIGHHWRTSPVPAAPSIATVAKPSVPMPAISNTLTDASPVPDQETRFAPSREPTAMRRMLHREVTKPKTAVAHAGAQHASDVPVPPAPAAAISAPVEASAPPSAPECPAAYTAWCLRDETMAADRHLRDAYRLAVVAGANKGRLRAIRHEWVRYRRLANKKPRELIRGYDGLTEQVRELLAVMPADASAGTHR